MTDDAGWKQVGDIFQTTGCILETGSFISKSGHVVPITDADASDFYNSLDENIPLTIDHNSETIGYAVKFTKTADNKIDHKGIVFNQDKFKDAVIFGGYNYISPEIEYSVDARGNVIDKKLVAISFVKNPAMDNTRVDVSRFAFSAPELEVKIMPDEQSANITQSPAQSIPTQTNQQLDIAALAELISAGVSEKFESKIEALQAELAQLKAKPEVKTATQEFLENGGVVKPTTDVDTVDANGFTTLTAAPPIDKEVFEEYAKAKAELESKNAELAKYREQSERVLRKQYSDVTAELKTLGYTDPAGLVKSLKTYEEKIETLNAIKVNHVKTTPMNSSQRTPMNTEGGSNPTDKLTLMTIVNSERMGTIPAEYLEHMSKKFGVPIQ